MVLVYDALDAFMAEKGASDELAPEAWRPMQGAGKTGRNTVIGDPGRTTEAGGAGTRRMARLPPGRVGREWHGQCRYRADFAVAISAAAGI